MNRLEFNRETSIPIISHKASFPFKDLIEFIYSLAINPPPQTIIRRSKRGFFFIISQNLEICI